MRNSTLLALGAVGALIVYHLWRESSAAGNLVFTPGNVTNMAFSGSTPVVAFTINVQNTSTTDLLLNSIAGNLYSNNTLVGNVSNFSPVTIAANSQTVLPVNASFQILGIANDLISAFQSGSTQQNLELEGFANVGGAQVPLDLKMTVG